MDLNEKRVAPFLKFLPHPATSLVVQEPCFFVNSHTLTFTLFDIVHKSTAFGTEMSKDVYRG